MMIKRRLLPAVISVALACDAAHSSESQGLEDYTEKILSRSIPMVGINGGEYTARDYNPTEQSDQAADFWEIAVSPFWIGKYELRMGEYEDWLKERKKARQDWRKEREKAHGDWREQKRPGQSLYNWLEENYRPAQNVFSIHAFEYPTSFGQNPTRRNDEDPIVGVHQWNAKRYCHWLSMRTGKFYRLPTEAEWEFACRAGNRLDRYPWGDSPDELSKYAVTAPPKSGGKSLQVVGTKKPNAWGIYDMIGNAEEWVADGYRFERYDGRRGETMKDPITWPASQRLSQDAKKLWQEFKAGGHRYADNWGVAKGGSHYHRRCQEPICFSVMARTNPSILSNDRDPSDFVLPQDCCRDLMWEVGEAVGFRIARPQVIPDRKTQLWHWGLYFDHDKWAHLTLTPTEEETARPEN